jgi:hypothetical protein
MNWNLCMMIDDRIMKTVSHIVLSMIPFTQLQLFCSA